MTFNILMAIGQAQRERNRDSYLHGKQRAAARQVWCAPTPFGYERDAKKRLIPSADAPTVQAIFRLRAEGKGFSQITHELGLRSRALARQVVRSETYLGVQKIPDPVRKGKPKILTDSHAALVSLAEFEAANAVRGKRPIRRDAAKRVKFKELAKCGCCGNSVGINLYGKPREKATYVCTRRNCGKVAIAALTLEPALMNAVRHAILERAQHVTATLTHDDRYARALNAVVEAQNALGEYLDNVDLQQAIGPDEFAAGARTRSERVEVARRALNATPKPDLHQGPLVTRSDGTLDVDVIDLQALTRRAIAEVLIYPRTSAERVTLRWHGSEAHIPVGLLSHDRRSAGYAFVRDEVASPPRR